MRHFLKKYVSHVKAKHHMTLSSWGFNNDKDIVRTALKPEEFGVLSPQIEGPRTEKFKASTSFHAIYYNHARRIQ